MKTKHGIRRMGNKGMLNSAKNNRKGEAEIIIRGLCIEMCLHACVQGNGEEDKDRLE